MYTVSKGPSKIVAKTRRGLSQNYEKFETIKESSKRNSDANSPEKHTVPRPVFQTNKRVYTHTKLVEEEALTPQHEEIIKYINDSWNIIVAQNPYDRAPAAPASSVAASTASTTATTPATAAVTAAADANNNNTAAAFPKTCISAPQTAASIYCVEPPSPVLSDFKPFDLESWWGRRLFNNITKSL